MRRTPLSAAVTAALLASVSAHAQTPAPVTAAPDKIDFYLEEITIVGDREDAANATGSAQILDSEELEKFEFANVQQILRAVPGVAIQLEDGYGLRPNLSIRGTATERSGRITLLEDNVLIAPAPYSAPSAYYFPTVGRMQQVEVLKGSSAIKQGPYTVGGAINMVSTQIPTERSGVINAEFGSNATTRLHAHYGDSQENFGWLVEAHLWDSEGFQSIDVVGGDTGLDKDDFTAKLRFNSDPGKAVYQQFDIKLQFAEESSDQSYLGLTDADFGSSPLRRYAASQLDNITTQHEQVILRYLASFNGSVEFTATAYNNTHERDWFKTERLDVDGSLSAGDFDGESWNTIIEAVNTGVGVEGATAAELQAILDGGNTAAGALQVRSNAREYFSRGIQLGLAWDKTIGATTHAFEFGLRYHEDEEDRLQRNSTYSQIGGVLALDDLGLLGNAGNRIQSAEAISFHAYDRIEFGNWTLTPGFRYEDIDQARVRYEIRDGQTTDPSSRADDNLRSMRENNTRVFLPGVGALYSFTDDLSVYGGVHKGFTAPSNSPGVNEEESVNYELGLRYAVDRLNVDAAFFFTDYDNLLGECTSSSGADCEIGSAFNGDAASIRGLELQATAQLASGNDFRVPLTLSYTYLDGQFDSDIADTAFFGDVSDKLSLYGRWENMTDESAIVGRQPYGARPLRDSTYSMGFRFSL